MAKLIDELKSGAEALIRILEQEPTQPGWKDELDAASIHLVALMRSANLQGLAPDHVYVLVDLQLLGKDLHAPVMLTNGGVLLPAYCNKADAAVTAEELDLAVMLLPIA